MTKTELIAAVAERSDLPKSTVDAVLASFKGVVESNLAQNNKIQWTGFMTMDTRESAARVGRNPQTGEAIQIAAKVVPTVKFVPTWRKALSLSS